MWSETYKILEFEDKNGEFRESASWPTGNGGTEEIIVQPDTGPSIVVGPGIAVSLPLTFNSSTLASPSPSAYGK